MHLCQINLLNESLNTRIGTKMDSFLVEKSHSGEMIFTELKLVHGVQNKLKTI